jgi:hypothetical protein
VVVEIVVAAIVVAGLLRVQERAHGAQQYERFPR